MPSLTKYDFIQQVNYSATLSNAIQQSAIITALDHVETLGTGSEMIVSIWFKDVLSEDDLVILNLLMETYIDSNLTSSPTSFEVITQFEKRDKTIKLSHGECTVGEDGIATILLKIPGEAGSSDGRWISSGVAFFDVHTPGDKVIGVYFTDEDNVLGNGAGTIIGSYTDDEVPEQNRGWAIPPNGWVKAEAIGGYGFAPAGFYIKVIALKAGESPSGKFYCNWEWGKSDV